MKRSTLTTLAATVLAASVSFGVVAPAASAAPHAGADKSGTHAKAQNKDDKRLLNEQRKVTREAARKNVALSRVEKHRTLGALEDSVADGVRANITADKTALARQATAASSATNLTGVRAVGRQVRAVRPGVYVIVVSDLRRADRFEAKIAEKSVVIAELAAQADAKELEGYDVTDVRTALQAATAANDEAATAVSSGVAQAVTLTATSPRADLLAVKHSLGSAGELLDVVEQQIQLAADTLAAMAPAEEPVVVEDPTAV